MSKIDDFKEYARRRIVERLRENKKEEEADTSKIEPYDEKDSFYSGSDDEYKEFLDGLDVELNDGEPVENTRKINLGETINVKDVLGKVKETAGNIAGAAASKVSEAAEKASSVKFKVRDDDDDNDETRFEKVEDNISADIDDMKAAITDTMNDSIQKIDGIDERLGGVSELFEEVGKNISELKETVSSLEKRLQELDIQTSDSLGTLSAGSADLKHEIGLLKEMTEQVRETVNGVTKLNDSVFDMKNAQQNTKMALSELQISFNRLKKKTVAGIVIISIIGFITIVLEVINLLA